MAQEYCWYLDIAKYESSCYYLDVFTSDECDTMVALCKDHIEKARVEGGDDLNDVRDSDIFFLPSNKDQYEWIFRRCVDLINDANEKYFSFDLTRIQNLQFTQYGVGQKYGKHIDMLYNSSSQDVRKLSFSIQLTDPDVYEGGDVLIHHSVDPYAVHRNKGSITFFPGYILHEVTPVTKGTRYSMVGWVTGPRWR